MSGYFLAVRGLMFREGYVGLLVAIAVCITIVYTVSPFLTPLVDRAFGGPALPGSYLPPHSLDVAVILGHASAIVMRRVRGL